MRARRCGARAGILHTRFDHAGAHSITHVRGRSASTIYAPLPDHPLTIRTPLPDPNTPSAHPFQHPHTPVQLRKSHSVSAQLSALRCRAGAGAGVTA